MLLCADWVIPVSTPPIADGAVLVVAGAIEAVGPAAELRARYPEEPVDVFVGCALLPGFVNAHTHLRLSAFQGFAPPSGFGRWMLRLIMSQYKLDLDDYAASALWGAHTCVRSGVTSIADVSREGWAVGRGARAAGLRARVYLEVFGLDDAVLPATMAKLEAELEQSRHDQDSTVGPATAGPALEWGVSPHAPYTVSPRLYREAARFARRAGLRLATHVAESPAEVEMMTRGTGALTQAYRVISKGRRWIAPGMSPVRYVNEAEALVPETLVIHAVQMDAGDISTLAATGTAVAHCPRSNRHLRCGIAPVAEMRAAGITVGLGTDSLASNDSLDMFDEMRAALEMSAARAGAVGGPAGAEAPAPPGALLPSDVLRMATLEGARALGWDHLVGSLEAGKRADIVAVQHGGATTADPVAALVRAGSAGDVRMTMVDGAPVFRGEDMSAEVIAGLRFVRAKLGLNDQVAGKPRGRWPSRW